MTTIQMNPASAVDDAAFEQLQTAMRSQLIRQSDAGYDTARAVYNAMIDKRPAAVARCVDVADVMAAVNFARDHDLLLALRGGGGNFGVVTSFEFRLHPVRTVYGGPVFYDVKDTAKLLRGFLDYLRATPDAMTAFFSFHQGPPAPFIPAHLHFVPIVTIMTCFSGPLDEAEAMLRPLRELAPPLVDLAGPIPYPALNSMFDAIYTPGLQHYWKADYVPRVSDEAIDIHARYGPQVPSLWSTMHLYPQSGAIQRVDNTDTAYNHRDVEFVHNIIAIDAEPANMPHNMAWMNAYAEALRPFSAAGGYVNFMMADEGQERVQATYRDNYSRLATIKAKHDPDNLFRVNQNIHPAAAS